MTNLGNPGKSKESMNVISFLITKNSRPCLLHGVDLIILVVGGGVVFFQNQFLTGVDHIIS